MTILRSRECDAAGVFRVPIVTGIAWLLNLLIATFSVGTVQAQEDFERALIQEAPKILEKLREAQVHVVGVLKFSVRKGNSDFSSSVGTINQRLADKLELALVMANPAKADGPVSQIAIIRNASSIAASIPNANHAKPEGQAGLFSRKYPLAWQVEGQDELVPDGFVCGVAALSEDLSSMQVELSLLKVGTDGLASIGSISVATDIDDLLESGESFTTRGIFDRGQLVTSKDIGRVRNEALKSHDASSAKTIKPLMSEHPLASSRAPLRLEVRYNNRIQSIKMKDGMASIPEPAFGEKISFVVRRTDSLDQTRYGVVLRVNGENTLYRETLPDVRAALWIMEPKMKEFGVTGYQLDDGKKSEFKVLSNESSRQRAIDYGHDVGLISMTVFEAAKEPALTPIDEAEVDLAIVSKGKLPAKAPSDRGQLAKSLTDQLVAQVNRGLIVDGAQTDSKITKTTFDRFATPVMAVSIRYYKP